MAITIRKKLLDVENYMQSCMTDGAHDAEHIYRVLKYALDIMEHQCDKVNYDLLVISCLLHDIGRTDQYGNPSIDHAISGSEKAYQWLIENGYSRDFASCVKECISTHRFRSNNHPKSIEAKILFDADKLDACGVVGVARALFSKFKNSEPLYSLNENGVIMDGTNDYTSSFVHEYKHKLEKLYDRFYTKRGAQLASERQTAAKYFYEALLTELRSCYMCSENAIKDTQREE
jgi:uncharacterized protein